MKYKYLLFVLLLILIYQSYSGRYLKESHEHYKQNKYIEKFNFKFRIHFTCKHLYYIVSISIINIYILKY